MGCLRESDQGSDLGSNTERWCIVRSIDSPWFEKHGSQLSALPPLLQAHSSKVLVEDSRNDLAELVDARA
jgi:hypothetical protein